MDMGHAMSQAGQLSATHPANSTDYHYVYLHSPVAFCVFGFACSHTPICFDIRLILEYTDTNTEMDTMHVSRHFVSYAHTRTLARTHMHKYAHASTATKMKRAVNTCRCPGESAGTHTRTVTATPVRCLWMGVFSTEIRSASYTTDSN